MRKRIRGLALFSVALLALSGLMWADSEGGSGPVKAGYAIVTPSGSNGSDLIVFETFGESQGNQMIQAGVLPANMTTSAVVLVRSDGRTSRNLGVAIANPGSVDANLTLTLHRADGTVVETKTIKVPAGQQTARFVTELFSDQPEVLSDFKGLLDIASDNPVAMVGLRFRGENFSTLPVTSLSAPTPVPVVSTGIGGANAVILPQFVTGGGFAAEISLGNNGAQPLTVRVDLFGQDALPLSATLNGQTASSFTNLTIPPGGVIVLAPLNNQGEDDF